MCCVLRAACCVLCAMLWHCMALGACAVFSYAVLGAAARRVLHASSAITMLHAACCIDALHGVGLPMTSWLHAQFPRTINFLHGMWDNTPLTSKHVDALRTWQLHNPLWIRYVPRLKGFFLYLEPACLLLFLHRLRKGKLALKEGASTGGERRKCCRVVNS